MSCASTHLCSLIFLCMQHMKWLLGVTDAHLESPGALVAVAGRMDRVPSAARWSPPRLPVVARGYLTCAFSEAGAQLCMQSITHSEA